MTNPLQQLNSLGQSVWYDNVQRGLLNSGQMQSLIKSGITGVTSNPTIFEAAITKSTDYDKDILAAVKNGKTVEEIYDILVFEDIRRVADLLSPVYYETAGQDGYVSIEVPPTLAKDTEATVREGRRIFFELGRPNVMIKVPATPEGIPAIKELIGSGINVNVTLIFGISEYEKVIEAYFLGLEELLEKKQPLKVASVASFFISRVDTMVDALIQERRLDPSWCGKAAIANAKMAYKLFQNKFTGDRFKRLQNSGARVQRPLWASTSTKNPNYSNLLYVNGLVGTDTVNTMPPNTVDTVLREGKFSPTIELGVDEAENLLKRLEQNNISISLVADMLLDAGVRSFEQSFQKLMENLKHKAESYSHL